MFNCIYHFLVHWTSPAVSSLVSYTTRCFCSSSQSAFILTTPINSEATAKFVTLQSPFPDSLQKCWTAPTRHWWNELLSPTLIFYLLNDLFFSFTYTRSFPLTPEHHHLRLLVRETLRRALEMEEPPNISAKVLNSKMCLFPHKIHTNRSNIGYFPRV